MKTEETEIELPKTILVELKVQNQKLDARTSAIYSTSALT